MTRITGIHPLAAAFPMMTEEELDDLAADIAEGGQHTPIIVDEAGVLIDGRNRLEACKRAKVEPKIEVMNGEDPVPLILSLNIHRRHMTKGQKAMAIAFAQPVALDKGGRGKTSAKNAGVIGVGERYASMARAVLKQSEDMARAVLLGQVVLNDAYAEVQRVEELAKQQTGDFTSEKQERRDRLGAEAPDLAVLVDDDTLTLEGAEAQLQARLVEAAARAREEALRLKSVSERVEDALRHVGDLANDDCAASVKQALSDPATRPRVLEQMLRGPTEADLQARLALFKVGAKRLIEFIEIIEIIEEGGGAA